MGISRKTTIIMETTTKIKLTYFNLRGRAEPSRLILAYAGVDFEDHRITHEEWPKLKPKTPCGQLPVLCYNGVEIGQSMSVARFLANEFGLAGKTNLERARADMIVDCVADISAGATAIFKAPADKKAELQKKYFTETIPAGLALLEKLLKQNGSKFFVGNCVTWADLLVANFCDGVMMKGGDAIFGNCAFLKSHAKLILDLPNIKKWIEARPKTDL